MKAVVLILAVLYVGLVMTMISDDYDQSLLEKNDDIYECEDFGGDYCYCWYDGKRITRFYDDDNLRTCNCFVEKYKAEKNGKFYVPQCQDEDGYYNTIQCTKNKNQCWCSDRLSGTATSNVTFGLKSCACLNRRYADERSKKKYITQCESDGSFRAMQSQGMLKWCVNHGGRQISKKQTDLESCDCFIHRSNAGKKSFKPMCEADGSYSAMQCHGSKCWCARPDGSRLDVKAISANICQCYRHQLLAIKAGKWKEIPECE